MRVRFTIDAEAWRAACEYAEATHRTPTGLIVEALEQIQARYPKRGHAVEGDVDVLAHKVASILRVQVPAGTLQGNVDAARG